MTASRAGLRSQSQKVTVAMSDLATLKQTILSQIAAASDEAALEAVRVAALGKKGSISALLATLGKMSPEERKTQGAAINLARDNVTHRCHASRPRGPG
jgi:phenylalanyl-tRNA synthetase alpha chain